MSLIEVASNRLKANGRHITIMVTSSGVSVQSWKLGVTTDKFYEGIGRFRHYKPQEVRGGILQGDSLFVVAPCIKVVPLVGMMISKGCNNAYADTDDWWKIVNVYAPEIGEEVALYRLQCRK